MAARGKVFLTGGSGRLGRTVLEMVDAVPLVRKPSGLRGEVVTDFSEGQLRAILRDAKAVIHLAGSVETYDPKDLREANVALTRRIVSSVPRGCRMVFASSISVYGKRLAHIPANEGTPPAPDSEYARTKREAERLVQSLPNHVILRVGTLYGPRFKDYFMIFRKLEKGGMRLIGSGSNRLPFVHVEDAARIFRLAITRGNGIYVIAGEPLRQEQVYRIAAGELGCEPPKAAVPLWLAAASARLGEIWFRILRKRPSMSVEHVSILGYDRAFDCKRARRELGFAPRPLAQGIREMVRAYRERAA